MSAGPTFLARPCRWRARSRGRTARRRFFIAPEKVGNELPSLLGDDIDIRGEADIDVALKKLGKDGKVVAIDPALAPMKYVTDLTNAGAKTVDLTDPCALAARDEERDGA